MIKFVCLLGIPYPAYKSYKIIHNLTQHNSNLSGIFQQALTILNYWIVFSLLAIFIVLFGGFLFYFPFVNEILFLFLFSLQTVPNLPELIIQKYLKPIINPLIPDIDSWLDRIKISPIDLFINFIYKLKVFIFSPKLLTEQIKSTTSNPNNLLLPPPANDQNKNKKRLRINLIKNE